MDFSGMSVIKLKTEEMEAQVRRSSPNIYHVFCVFSVAWKWSTTLCCLDLSGEGAAAGEPAGAGASPSGGAEEEALRARGLRGRR